MKNRLSLGLVSAALVISGCAQKAIDKSVEEKVSEQAPVASSAELRTEARDLIEKSALRPEQKEKLRELSASTAQKTQKIQQQVLKLRSVLIKEVLSDKYSKIEALTIQSKIKKLEEKRLALMFTAIDKANGIIGRETQAEESERMMEQMIRNPDARQ